MLPSNTITDAQKQKGFEMYQEARRFIEGSEGYPENPKKGYALLKDAAELNDTACCDYAIYLLNVLKKPDLAVTYFERFDTTRRACAEEYCCALWQVLKKNAKNPDLPKTFYKKVEDLWEDELNEADGFYYYALLARAGGAPEEHVNNAMLQAIWRGSQIVPDAEYAKLGRERGVFANRTEILTYLESREEVDELKGSFGGFFRCEKNEEQAWKTVQANLDEKRITSKLPMGAAKVFASGEKPKGVLEYQRLFYGYMMVGEFNGRYTYDHPKMATVQNGSATLAINEARHRFFATFQHAQPQTDLYKIFANLKASQTDCCEGRFRHDNPYDDEVSTYCAEQIKSDCEGVSRYQFRKALASQYNWEEKYIRVEGNELEVLQSFMKDYYVPFWFFTKKVGMNVITLRVNATTGEVDAFVNNPFGLFAKEDDMAAGGFKTKLDKNGQPLKRKTRGAKKTLPTPLIVLIAAVLFLLVIPSPFNIILLIGAIAGWALIKNRKKFKKKK